ncbi:transporter substrate-binding domain-containing protein [Parasphaerochaeta coccoides]|uniref:Extracellular solute-binding protein family 3 n=1 Tax=Parasphaerochaeta coccoides (strain ATCC BAA-1237 / DSM 17374 / SPN1) TaxID=760011 RepID=F4GLJ2_PARC1|nr:transporter substrate-binding domain-containing protein [Parasphaerochaeta coccoides]AEC01962.1 extracellular solute-binding protein family 3 [Parasphaerochaeta coccoides DSM 17374]
MKTKTLALLLIISLVSVMAVGAAGSKESSKEKTSYVFAANAAWPPLEYVDENGNVVGYEIELIQEIGKAVGKTFTIRNVAWDGIFAGLANGAYDGIASGVSVTEERKATMDFSTPILQVKQAIIVRSGTTGISSGDDLVGKKVGVQIGTTGHIALEDTYGKAITIRAYDEIGLAIEDMLNGNLDAAVADSIIASDFVLANKNYQGKLFVSGEASSIAEDIAIVVPKGNVYLLGLVNDGYALLVKNGTVATLKEKYNLL